MLPTNNTDYSRNLNDVKSLLEKIEKYSRELSEIKTDVNNINDKLNKITTILEAPRIITLSTSETKNN